MSAEQTIREILQRYDEQPGEGVTWKVQSATVITHKALERIAGKAKISFAAPTIIRAERDEAVILVTGTIAPPAEQSAPPETAWSIGEALIGANYRVSGKQAAYVYAMAEKRAKDRVILKLIGLHGLLYSEEEADDFRRPRQGGPQRAEDRAAPAEENDSAALRFIAQCEGRIDRETNRTALLTWWNGDERKAHCRDFDLTEEELGDLKARVTDRAAALLNVRAIA